MAVVHHLGREHRLDLLLEVLLPEVLLFLVQLFKIQALVALFFQGRRQLVHDFVALFLQGRRLGHDGSQLLLGGHVGFILGFILLQQGLIVQRTDPDHEKLVQIAAVDPGKFQLFGQRNVLILGKGQHPLVKIQPAQFPVDENILFFLHAVSPFPPRTRRSTCASQTGALLLSLYRIAEPL